MTESSRSSASATAKSSPSEPSPTASATVTPGNEATPAAKTSSAETMPSAEKTLSVEKTTKTNQPPDKEVVTVKGQDHERHKQHETTENGRENQVVHTPSVSIKGVLKGEPREIPVADDEIGENDQVARDETAEADTVEITETDIQEAWRAYARSIEKSHPRIYSTMNQQEPTMTSEGIIQITLNTNAQREYFVHSIKPELTRYFQKKLANIDFVFETNLIANESASKMVYTDQDKLDFMARKNPELQKLKNRFGLDFDH